MSCRIGIIDHGLSNINSICRAIEFSGGLVSIVKTPADLSLVDKVVIPGVGAFGSAIQNLNALELVASIKSQVLDRHTMVLGVCLGMQLLAASSEESRGIAGIGLLPGEVKKLRPIQMEVIPHIGWNSVHQKVDNPLFKNIQNGSDFYFVHSYHFQTQKDLILGETPFCGRFNSVVGKGNIFGVQFHPEKSQKNGLSLLKNFIEL